MTSGRSQMLATRNFRDWHAIIGEVTWSSVLKTTMDCHSELVLHSLGNNQPVQVVVHQRNFRVAVTRRAAAFWTCCNITVHDLLRCRGQNRVAIVNTRCNKPFVWKLRSSQTKNKRGSTVQQTPTLWLIATNTWRETEMYSLYVSWSISYVIKPLNALEIDIIVCKIRIIEE